jgi:hypothetical protein
VLAAVTAVDHVGASFAAYWGRSTDEVVARMQQRTGSYDKSLQTFSRKWGVLGGARPTIARFLQQK